MREGQYGASAVGERKNPKTNILEENKKYVLWNTGICPNASKVGHVTLSTPPFGSFIVPYVVLAMAYPTKKKTKSLASSV